MVRSLPIAPLALILAAQPALAAERPPIQLPRVTNWEINYDEDACHLMTEFRDDTQRVLFKMTKTGLGNVFDLTLIGPQFANNDLYLPVEVKFGSGKPSNTQGLSAVTASEKIPLIIISQLQLGDWIASGKDSKVEWYRELTPEQEAAVKFVEVKPGRYDTIQLKTGSMSAPMKAMRECTDNLIRYWGYDPAQLKSLSSWPRPLNNPQNWLTTPDYPSASLDRFLSGKLKFRLDVSEDGRVQGCRILNRNNRDEFAITTCKLVKKRARFDPARDSQGEPTKAYYINSVIWLAG